MPGRLKDFKPVAGLCRGSFVFVPQNELLGRKSFVSLKISRMLLLRAQVRSRHEEVSFDCSAPCPKSGIAGGSI